MDSDAPDDRPKPKEDAAEPDRLEGGLRHRRVLAVVNPVSGIFRHERTVRELKQAAERHGVDLAIVLTQPDMDVEASVRTAAGPFDCYLAVGGDGTVVETAAVAVRDGIPLAMLPRGTANALAWHFRIPFDAGQGFRVAVRGVPMAVDVAHSPDRPFLIMAGLGYDAHIVEGATRLLKRRLGFLAYLVAALRQLGRRPYVFRVHLDDHEPFRVSGLTAIITNTGTLAGNVRLVRKVSPLDGLLDLIVVSPENFGAFFRMLFWGVLGRLQEDPRVRYYQARRIRVESRPAAPLEVDGDAMGTRRELQAEVLPKALTLMVPAEGTARFPWVPERPWSPSSSFPWFKTRGREGAVEPDQTEKST